MDFLGAMTRDSYVKQWTTNPEDRFVSTELPAFDEEYFEWIDLLEAVVHSRSGFAMIELGAGWGRWLARAGVALRVLHRSSYKLIGVEAEPTHFGWMVEHLKENGLDNKDCLLIQAAVTDRDGQVRFYVGRADEWYGQAVAGPAPMGPIWSKLRRFVGQALKRGSPDGIAEVRALSLNTILRDLDRVDLIDLDVQGVELSVLESAAAEINKKVERIHIGTHSPEIESGLRGMFDRLGWSCLCDYAMGGHRQTPYGQIAFQDGVQSWVNPHLQ